MKLVRRICLILLLILALLPAPVWGGETWDADGGDGIWGAPAVVEVW